MNKIRFINSLLGLFPRQRQFSYESETKGIVMPVPGKYFHHAYFLCRSLRRAGCQLPIEIWQAGVELDSDQISRFKSIPNLEIYNILEHINGKPAEHFRGFQMKPLSMICSSLQHVLLVDADLVFLINPESLFDAESYKEHGCLFWHDRLAHIEGGRYIRNSYAADLWYRIKVRNPSKYLKDSDFWNKRSMNYQESGTVYFDKSKFQDTLKNLYQLNMDHEMTYHFMHGDKETFWLACEMTSQKELCHFVVEQRAHIGGVKGHILHSDLQGKPFWFQHGMGIGKKCQPIIEPKIAWVKKDHQGFGILEAGKDHKIEDLEFSEEELSGDLLETYNSLRDDWISITKELGIA